MRERERERLNGTRIHIISYWRFLETLISYRPTQIVNGCFYPLGILWRRHWMVQQMPRIHWVCAQLYRNTMRCILRLGQNRWDNWSPFSGKGTKSMHVNRSKLVNWCLFPPHGGKHKDHKVIKCWGFWERYLASFVYGWISLVYEFVQPALPRLQCCSLSTWNPEKVKSIWW